MHTFRYILAHFWRCFAPFCHPAVLCVLLLVQLAGGTAFPLKDAAGQKSLGLADPSSSQRHVAVAETKTPEPLPEFDPDNPLAIGIILAFHRWPDEDEQRIILEKTREAGLTKTEEIPRFKIWLFEWDEWRKAATAEKVCRSLPDLSSLEYCEPDSLLGPATGSVNKCRLRAEIPLISRVQISQATSGINGRVVSDNTKHAFRWGVHGDPLVKNVWRPRTQRPTGYTTDRHPHGWQGVSSP